MSSRLSLIYDIIFTDIELKPKKTSKRNLEKVRERMKRGRRLVNASVNVSRRSYEKMSARASAGTITSTRLFC